MAAGEAREKEMKAIDNLDRLIHEPARLKIFTHLHVVESGDFIYLMRATGLTRGNLSSHMTKLEEAGYIEVIKEFVDRKPLTLLKITDKGRRTFLEYRKNMAKVLEGE